MKTIVVFKTEQEALRAKALLKEAAIPFVLRSYGDAAYSSVFQTQHGWGVLEAHEEDEATILELLKTQIIVTEQTEVGNALEVKVSKEIPTVWINVVAVVFFISSCILGWMYWDTKKEYTALLDYDLRNFEWSKDGEILVGRWKKNDKLALMSYDTDFDLIFDREE